MDPSRWQACEALVKELAAGGESLALPQPTELQRTLKTPPHVLYLCGLVAGSQEHFVKLQKLYHQSSQHNDEPRIYHWSPSMMPSEADQLLIDQDINRKMQELQTASENIKKELLASLQGEAKIKTENDDKSSSKKSKRHNSHKKKKPKQLSISQHPKNDQNADTTSTTHKKYETLEQVLAQIQVPQYDNEIENDDSWVQVGRKPKIPANSKTAKSNRHAANDSDMNAKENETNTKKEISQILKRETRSTTLESTAASIPKSCPKNIDEISKANKLPPPSDENEAILVSNAAPSPKSDDIKTSSKETEMVEKSTETSLPCVNTKLADGPTTVSHRILEPPTTLPMTSSTQKVEEINPRNDVSTQNECTIDSATTTTTKKDTPKVTHSEMDNATVSALETRIQHLELTVQEKDGELQKKQDLHQVELRKQREQFEERIQALQLRLYISENRLKTYEEALVDHVNAVATNVAEGTAVVTTTANASVTTPKGSAQVADHNSEETPLEHSPGKRPWMSTNSTATKSLAKVATKS